MVQSSGGFSRTAAAAAASGHQAADPAGGAAGDFPGKSREAGNVSRPLGARFPKRSATSTRCGGPRRCCARCGWKRRCKTPAHIYYKYEGASPAGSHKPNTAVAQAYYNKVAGTKRLATETGAGQWGSSLALACKLFGLECNVYMVKVSYDQKPYRRMLMHTWGATVHPSPSDQTEYGRKLLARRPELSRQPRHRHQRGHRGHRHASEHEIFARQRAQPRLPAPDRHRPGSHQADGNGRRGAGRRSSAAAAAAAISPGWRFRSFTKKSRRRRNTASSPSSRRPVRR